ncbi:GAF and ANTAR domain-containing protein [Geodermatophilus sp. DSM 44513]|uniref:GAF and ANTAR domain-containing protein n=1 Tax=Geodermatophilus sp. DSM 44513 TaxID=1528104 RepID=UPI001281DA39|nr:GAF and ANTAR domain-containing protein [Geodermatophilus sp. DSM 44513]WNV74056.1 GAF and ANTAR domain-containing protein [Geodermatophilus sp. DSM 44513]
MQQGPDARELLASLASSGDLGSFLGDLVELTARQVPHAEACGLTLTRSATGVTVASTGPLADRADEEQYQVDAGPCLESMRTGTVVRVEDMRTERRWAPYPERAAELGVRSSLSLPLDVEGRSAGALNLYATAPGVFTAEDEAVAAGWAEQATGALAVALRVAGSDDRAKRLLGGLDTRAAIGQAVGLLMAQERCTAAAAFDLLRIASQRRNVKLHEVAAGVVTAFEEGLADRPGRW